VIKIWVVRVSVVRRVGAVGLKEDLAAVRIRMGPVVGRMVTAGKKILLRLWRNLKGIL